MKKITTVTDEQWEEIDAIKQTWIDNTTQQHSHDDIRQVVGDMWRAMGYAPPLTLIAHSPLEMIIWSAIFSKFNTQLDEHLRTKLRNQLYQFDEQLSYQLDDQLRIQLGEQLSAKLYTQLSDQLNTQLNTQLRDQLHDQLHDQLSYQLHDQLHYQLNNQLYTQLRNQLSDQLSDQLNIQLHDQLRTQLHDQLSNQINDQPRCVGVYWRVWSGWFAGAKKLGVKFDDEKLDLFTRWCDMAAVCCPFEKLCVVSANPIECHWLDEELHNSNGPAALWEDGWSMWAINGVAVDEQIVMRPNEQSIETIRNEQNEEVKRIRIERYGWDKFMRAVKAKPINSRRNDVDGTHEGLFELPDGMKTFVGRCRSTGRVYFLEVAAEIETCEQAQSWMVGRGGNCIGAS